MSKGRKEARETSRAEPRQVERELTDTQYEELEDRYYYDRNLRPDDMIYEWKRHTIINKEDPNYQNKMQRHGWRVVPGSRHPELGGKGENPIIIDGNVLMEKNAVSVEISKEKELQESVKNQRDHFKRLQLETPAQTLKLGRTYEQAQPIPE